MTKEHYEIRLKVKLDDQQQDLEEVYGRKKESMQQIFNAEIRHMRHCNDELTLIIGERERMIKRLIGLIRKQEYQIIEIASERS